MAGLVRRGIKTLCSQDLAEMRNLWPACPRIGPEAFQYRPTGLATFRHRGASLNRRFATAPSGESSVPMPWNLESISGISMRWSFRVIRAASARSGSRLAEPDEGAGQVPRFSWPAATFSTSTWLHTPKSD